MEDLTELLPLGEAVELVGLPIDPSPPPLAPASLPIEDLGVPGVPLPPPFPLTGVLTRLTASSPAPPALPKLGLADC